MKSSGRTVQIFYSYLFCLKKHLLLFIFQFFFFYETKIPIVYILFRGKSVCLEEHAQQRNSTVLCRQQF